MPCYSIVTQSIELGQINYALLDEALKLMGAERIQRIGSRLIFGLGYSDYALEGSTLSSTAYDLQDVKARIKQAVSRVVVNRAAARMGWLVTEAAPNRLTVKRRF